MEQPFKSRYEKNLNHKEKQLRKVKLEVKRGTEYPHLTKNFNFKKTNAFKGMWSCTGYGGKCGSCRVGNYGDGKKYVKEYYSFGDSEHFRIARLY